MGDHELNAAFHFLKNNENKKQSPWQNRVWPMRPSGVIKWWAEPNLNSKNRSEKSVRYDFLRFQYSLIKKSNSFDPPPNRIVRLGFRFKIAELELNQNPMAIWKF